MGMQVKGVRALNNTIFHRRRVERFAQLLEDAGRRRHGRSPFDDDLAAYVELGQRLREEPRPAEAVPEEDFRTSLRAMLVATAQREGIGRAAGGSPAALGRAGVDGPRDQAYPAGVKAPAEGRPPRLSLHSRRTRAAIIVALAAGTLALSGMSAASGDAVPGDPLYGIKRSAEGARLALTTNDMMRGQLYLDFAGNRATEAARGAEPGELIGLLTDMDSQTIAGVRLLTGWAVDRRDGSALDFLDEWTTTQRARLGGLDVTGSDGQRVGGSVSLLLQIQTRSSALHAALACGAMTGHTDRFGPVPAPCPTASGSGSHLGRTGNSGSSGSSGGAGSPGIRSSSGASPTRSPAGTAPTGAPSPQTSPSQPASSPLPSPSGNQQT
jgi:hypothetical protein